ncbi:homeobox-leucine zipper protein HOX11-like [Musa acuminata AAA Group]|uniref:homeobox-leucine zipper protein HOX11-like n=1 Tax=Musa acuminata AAA Group TaxID=214697 RepID=UPI0031D6B5EF
MELGLRMGEAPARRPLRAAKAAPLKGLSRLALVLGIGRSEEGEEEKGREEEVETEEKEEGEGKGSGEPPPQLNLEALLPAPPQRSSPALLRRRWATETRNSEASMRGLDVNRSPSAEERASSSSSPNSTVSCPQMDFSAQRGGGVGAAAAAAVGRASSRVSDEEENGLVRKKLRLSKEQSDSLEESFKEHSTLNPKQKLALSEQLNLRPRQVEVWFQNRRARTKLKQTEVHCEYLNRCCQTLMEENRRLQKKVAELRALQTSCHDFSMHLPATTLSMCPSCERVAPTPTSNSASAAAASDHQPNSFSALIPKPRPSSLAVQPAPAASRQSSPAS